MAHGIEISAELQEWAALAGFSLTQGPVTDDGRAILYNGGGEIRYFVKFREDGWLVVTESERMGDEYFVVAVRSPTDMEKYFFGAFGRSIRRRRGLADVRLPTHAGDVSDGFALTETDFDGRDRRALVDLVGRIVAVSSGDAVSGTWELARLSLYLVSSVEQIVKSFEDPAGKPLFTLQDGDASSPTRPVGAPTGDPEHDFLAEFAQAFNDADGPPAARGFTIVDDSRTEPDAARRDDQIRAQASTMLDRAAQELAHLGPQGWLEFRAVFSLTVRGAVARLEFATADGVRPARVPEQVVDIVRRQREFTAQMSAGPWWRLLMTVTNEGLLSVSYDYGDDPLPDDQLQPAQNYRDDIAAYPRPGVPVWLAGYLAGPAAQGRTPQQAAQTAAADRAAGRSPTETDDIEPLPDTWTRWAVLAAVYVGVRSPWGPRVSPGLASYESDARSGSTLYVLPGDRAVLSGGRWDSPLLIDAYQRHQPLPDLYAGAPDWVNDSVLNTRNQNGLLTFCYWHADGQWWRGGTDTFDELDAPLPQIWTTEETVAAMAEVVGPGLENACHQLLSAASSRSATRNHLFAVLARARDADLDAAHNQLSLAGLTP